MNQLGYYGKITHRGDFVRFNLPQSFITVWDDWLREIMIQGEKQHANWADLYTRAPDYRFVLSSGIAGNTPWMGVLTFSTDKVGRRFPFCLAVSLPETALATLSLLSNDNWFSDAETLLNTLQASYSVFDELQTELEQLAQRHSPSYPASSEDLVHSKHPIDEHFTICMKGAATASQGLSLAPLLDSVLQQTASEYSLWRTADPGGRLILSNGLPTENSGIALINEDWEFAASSTINLSAMPMTPVEPDITMERTGENIKALAPEQHELVDEQSQVATTLIAQSLATTRDSSLAAAALRTDDNTKKSTQSAEAAPSADDWAALDSFSDDNALDELIVPKVETLELDDDDLPDAPWEQ